MTVKLLLSYCLLSIGISFYSNILLSIKTKENINVFREIKKFQVELQEKETELDNKKKVSSYTLGMYFVYLEHLGTYFYFSKYL